MSIGQNIKIGIFEGNIPPSSTFIHNLILGLADRHTVYVYGTLKKDIYKKHPNILTVPFPRKRVFVLFAVFWGFLRLAINNYPVFSRLIQLTKRKTFRVKLIYWNRLLPILNNPPDLLHVQWIKAFGEFQILKKLLSIKLIVSLRGYQVSVSPFLDTKLATAYKRYFKEVDAIHTISDDLLKQAILLGAEEKKAFKITPALDLELFKYRGEKLLDKSKGLKIVTVSSLFWKKGLSYALAAISICKEMGCKLKYDIYGDGRDREELLFHIKDLGIESFVELKGRIPYSEIPKTLAKYDVYLQPSVQEGFCNAVVEAQAVGLPCIVTNAEGLPENIGNGETGWVIPSRSPERIVESIKTILEIKMEDWLKLQSKSRKWAVKQYDIDHQMELFEQFYRKVALES